MEEIWVNKSLWLVGSNTVNWRVAMATQYNVSVDQTAHSKKYQNQ